MYLNGTVAGTTTKPLFTSDSRGDFGGYNCHRTLERRSSLESASRSLSEQDAHLQVTLDKFSVSSQHTLTVSSRSDSTRESRMPEGRNASVDPLTGISKRSELVKTPSGPINNFVHEPPDRTVSCALSAYTEATQHLIHYDECAIPSSSCCGLQIASTTQPGYDLTRI